MKSGRLFCSTDAGSTDPLDAREAHPKFHLSEDPELELSFVLLLPMGLKRPMPQRHIV